VGGERNRGLYVLKSRGMSHSNQIREFVITSHGIDLLDVYTGPEGVLTGSARVIREAKERADRTLRDQETDRKRLEIERRRRAMEGEVALLEAEFEAERARIAREMDVEDIREKVMAEDRD